MANAVQVSASTKGGSAHAVAVGDLRVLIMHEGPTEWYAQGLEIDYLAQGRDLKDVQQAFETGLRLTIEEHLKFHGHIKQLLRVAPQSVWDEFYFHATSEDFTFSQVSRHDLETHAENTVLLASTQRKAKKKAKKHKTQQPYHRWPASRGLPFGAISYLELQPAA